MFLDRLPTKNAAENPDYISIEAPYQNPHHGEKNTMVKLTIVRKKKCYGDFAYQNFNHSENGGC